MRDTTNQIADAIVRASPPAAVAYANQVLDMPVEKWLTVTMIVYTVLQMILLVRDRVVRHKRETDKP